MFALIGLRIAGSVESRYLKANGRGRGKKFSLVGGELLSGRATISPYSLLSTQVLKRGKAEGVATRLKVSAIGICAHAIANLGRRSAPRLMSHPALAGFNAVVGAVLCLLLVLPVLVPLAAYAESPAPTCCKGQYHCRYCIEHHRGAAAQTPGAVFHSTETKCPRGPIQLPGHFPHKYAIAAGRAFEVHLVVHPSGLAQTQARQRLTSIRVRQKRGPPTLQSTI